MECLFVNLSGREQRVDISLVKNYAEKGREVMWQFAEKRV